MRIKKVQCYEYTAYIRKTRKGYTVHGNLFDAMFGTGSPTLSLFFKPEERERAFKTGILEHQI